MTDLIQEVERLSKLCEAKDGELAELRTSLSGRTCFVPPEFQQELQAAKAQIAMMRDVIEGVQVDPAFDDLSMSVIDETYKALSATNETTEAFLNERDAKYEWLWERCKIVFFPKHDDEFGTYPIEHSPHARKDSRTFIESKMAVELRAKKDIASLSKGG